MNGIEGKATLITGGGSGIGLGTAMRFASDGAHVTICGRTEDKLARACEQIGGVSAPGAVVQYIVADVTVEEQIAAAMGWATQPTGALDILFCCAGGAMHMGPIATADAAGVRATVDLNLIGTFLSIKHAVPLMSDGGAIVAMSSGAGHFPHRYLWAYGMAKAGIEMLVRSAAEELAEAGIRVNAVQPGIIDDELMEFIIAGGPLLDDYMAQTPISRPGKVEEVADAVRFLAGPEAAWITGECLAVDGGHHLRRGANYGLLLDDS
ncbi:MAG TPA: SDR family oxidoreductase [Acidimicrobiales bacterium]|nr:SDR family oxidoreductase [Acidimicrobiales bacterium]